MQSVPTAQISGVSSWARKVFICRYNVSARRLYGLNLQTAPLALNTMVLPYLSTLSFLLLLMQSSAESQYQKLSVSCSTTTSPAATGIPSAEAGGTNYTSLGKNLTAVTIVDPETRQSRNIAYFVNRNGQAIVDDDILFGSEEYLLSLQPGRTPLRKRWYGVKTSYAWPDGIIHYKYESDEAERRHSQPMNEALDLWNKYVPYITFVKDTNDPVIKHKDVVTITSISGDGCHSNVAFDQGKNSVLQINFDPSWNSNGRQYRHEWGHQLGLKHEHSHPDRERFVHFHCEALDTNVKGCTPAEAASTDCCQNPKAKCCSYLYQFDNTPYPQYQKGRYNPDSVMHYPSDAFAKIRRSTLTKVADNGIIPMNMDISQGDIDGVCIIYDYLCDAWKSTSGLTGLKKTSGWTFSVPDPPYAEFSDWSLYPAPDTKFVTLKGKRTINTKCLSVLETTVDPGNPDSTTTALKLIPKGANFTFETMRDEQHLPPDHCCISLYEDSACQTDPFEKACHTMGGESYLKKDLRSWRVWNCTGLWSGIPA